MWPSSISFEIQQKLHMQQAPYSHVVITRIPNSSATSFAKEYIIPSTITQVTGPRSEFLLYSASILRKSGFVTDLNEMTMSLVKSKVRGWSFGRPLDIDSKWRVGKWVESSCSWVRRWWLCSVFRKVTWSPALDRSCAMFSMGLMWPSKGNGNISICGCWCWRPILT